MERGRRRDQRAGCTQASKIHCGSESQKRSIHRWHAPPCAQARGSGSDVQRCKHLRKGESDPHACARHLEARDVQVVEGGGVGPEQLLVANGRIARDGHADTAVESLGRCA
eukprot:883977-Pleurochrysis_carterae.AAC.1